MTQILYATFIDADRTERAVGALIDNGVRREDITVVGSLAHTTGSEAPDNIEDSAKAGISTTTSADAAAGAAKGAGIGLGVGVLAGLAALTIPGVGIVLGAGAVASAIGAAAATTAAGAVAGGAAGYLEDQGLAPETALVFSRNIEAGGTLLSLTVPSGSVDVDTATEIVNKYGGGDISVH